MPAEPSDGVMLYAPLRPTPESELEFADSDVVLEYIDDPGVPPRDENGAEELELARPKTMIERRQWHPSATQLSLQVFSW
jgi:hypothetical protein